MLNTQLLGNGETARGATQYFWNRNHFNILNNKISAGALSILISECKQHFTVCFIIPCTRPKLDPAAFTQTLRYFFVFVMNTVSPLGKNT